MLRTILLVALVALACEAAPAADDELYKSVLIADYDSAVIQSKDLVKKGKGEVIFQVVDKLIDESQRNLIDYAYQLWTHDAKDLVKNYFPLEITTIVGQYTVKIIGKRDNMVMKLGAHVDSDGDRTAYGDSNLRIGDRMAFKFIPVSDEQMHFKIYNPQTNQFLKLGIATDSENDHAVYGDSKSDSKRHQFYLVPVKYEDELLFYIFNREYQQALKLSRAVDSDGDRQVFSESGNVIGEPYAFGWIVTPL